MRFANAQKTKLLSVHLCKTKKSLFGEQCTEKRQKIWAKNAAGNAEIEMSAVRLSMRGDLTLL